MSPRSRPVSPSARPLSRVLAAAALAGLAGLCACAPQVEAPTDAGSCWHMVHTKAGKYDFHKLADHVPNLETCAARLEAMRIRFVQLGGTHLEISGAYQGQFLFIQREGVFTSSTVDGTPYLALVRTGDGRLAIPGAMPQGQ